MRSFEASLSDVEQENVLAYNKHSGQKIVRTIKLHHTNWELALINNVSRNVGFKRMLYTVPNVIEIKGRSPIPP